jgi:hypothetical protein
MSSPDRYSARAETCARRRRRVSSSLSRRCHGRPRCARPGHRAVRPTQRGGPPRWATLRATSSGISVHNGSHRPQGARTRTRTAEGPFSKAEDLAAVLAWEHDLGSDNLYWADQVYEIHGCSDDFEPSIERVAELSHPDDRRKLWEAVERATTAGEPYDIADERTFTAPT